jgi:serine/threonine protein kinase/tetratricopeptide (TPR) repeat protein
VASLIGKEIGKYRITERLGQGGMAEVYAGIHTHLDRKVAVKVLHSYLLESGDFIARFKREAKAVANLRHPNIVQVYDFDIQEDLIFMVMEYVDGVNLHTKLVEVGNQGERMPIKLIGSIINDIASALDYAHSKGMLHRDIKPSNIMIDNDNKAYLTDFGIAKLLSDQKFTATGTLVGTPAYMSPEQGRGDDLTEESDIYSLGIIAFEMLTGQVPYDAKTPIGIVHKQINDPVPNMSELVDGVPGSAQEVIDRALAKSPEGRFSSAEALVGALRVALTALESTDPIAVPAEEGPTMVDDGMEAPTVTMQAEEMEQVTVVMETEKKKEEPPETEPKKKEPKKKPAPKPKGEKKKIPLWAFIAGGVAVLGITAVLLTQVFDIDLFGAAGGILTNTVEVSVHASDGTDGLTLESGGDGDFEYVTIEGLAGWRTGSGRTVSSKDGNDSPDSYIYFQIDDAVLNQLPAGAEVYIDVELLNNGSDTLYIQYDAHDPGDSGDERFKETQAIAKTNSGEFTIIRFVLTNAFFGNRTNGNDFRINDNGDGPEVIRSVKVVYVEFDASDGESLFHEGEALYHSSEYDQAIEIFDQALNAGFESPDLYHLRGLANHWLGNTQQSIDDLSMAIELDEGNFRYWMERGLRKFDLGDVRGAIEDLTIAADKSPNEWEVWNALGEVYYFSGLDEYWDDAHAAFDRALEIDPGNPHSHRVLGDLNWRVFGNPEAALENFHIAVENSEPGDPSALNERGLFYLETGQFELCIPDYNAAIEFDPGNPWFFLNRGDCFSGLGDIDAAKADYERFLELAQSNDELRDQVNRVEEWLGEN